MWPFIRQKSDTDIAIEAMPQAIEIAAQKWIEFSQQTCTADLSLAETCLLFSEGLGRGFKQWEAFSNAPDAFFFLIAAKGIEKSRTHLRIEIEAALGIPIPTPHERTDAEENLILQDRLIDRAREKWIFFCQSLHFTGDVTLEEKVAIFTAPFVLGARADFFMFRDAPNEFFRPIIALGISHSGTLSLDEIEAILKND